MNNKISEQELKIRLELTDETKSLGIDLSSENAKGVFEDLVYFRLNKPCLGFACKPYLVDGESGNDE
jgi:hypothetical protein